jgi:hypothetical protein
MERLRKVATIHIWQAISIKWLQKGYKWDKNQPKFCPTHLAPLYALAAKNINIDKDYGDIKRIAALFPVKKT